MTTSSDQRNEPPSAALRSRWLTALLPRVPSEGWSGRAATNAACDAGLNAGEQALAAPGGVRDLMEAFFDRADAETRTAIAAQDLLDMKIHERVAFGLRTWLDTLASEREAVRRASARAFWPFSAGDAAQRCWSVADMVWEAIGDTSDDYNRYTKRGLLTAVIPPIVAYWLTSPDSDAMDAFIAKRLRRAMWVGKTGGQFVKPVLDAFSRRPGPAA
ncbi:MAG: COQ9 family protein [Pseudomonadota bacterium]